MVTRFGDITVRRRLYIDSEGEYHFPLDEYMDWKPNQAAKPSLTASLVRLSTEIPFRKVVDTMADLLAGILSRATIHRLLGRISQTAMEGEKGEYQASFKEGKLPEPGEKKSSVIYTEADGVWVHLQREKKKHYELKSAIAYDGWERLPQKEERYRLTNKVVYCRSDASIPLWDRANLMWHKHWDLTFMKVMVVNGDGTKWIDKGAYSLLMYEYIRSGTIRQMLGDAEAREEKTAKKAREYVVRH